MECGSQRKLGGYLAAEQRAGAGAGAGEAGPAEAEEHVQEALHGLCSCRRPEPSSSGARETACRRTSPDCEDDEALFVDEARLD